MTARTFLAVYRVGRASGPSIEISGRTFCSEDDARDIRRGPNTPRDIEVVDVIEVCYSAPNGAGAGDGIADGREAGGDTSPATGAGKVERTTSAPLPAAAVAHGPSPASSPAEIAEPRCCQTWRQLHEHTGALLRAHDARITELLAANTAEVERRREAETRAAAAEARLTRFDDILSKDQAYGHLSHVEIAGMVRMLMRSDTNHEGVCTAARDRIIWLANELGTWKTAAKALRDALLEHHKWHMGIGTIAIARDDAGQWIEIDMTVEYSDAPMCDRTVDALRGVPLEIQLSAEDWQLLNRIAAGRGTP